MELLASRFKEGYFVAWDRSILPVLENEAAVTAWTLSQTLCGLACPNAKAHLFVQVPASLPFKEIAGQEKNLPSSGWHPQQVCEMCSPSWYLTL